jgi:hypothetical protein
MTVAVAKYARRPKRTWQADGLADMAIGTAMLCIALIFLDSSYMILFTQTHSVLSPEYTRATQLNILVTSFLQLVVVVPFLLIEPLKRLFVYPRSGYMQLRVSPKRWVAPVVVTSLLFLFLISFGTMAGVAELSHFWTTNRTLLCVEAGIGLALISNYMGVGFVRHLIVGAISLAVTIGLVTTSLDWQRKFFILAVAIGVSLLIAGALPFARLIRTPLNTEAAE